MAVTLIKNSGVTQMSIGDFRSWAEQNPKTSFRMNNRQIDYMDIVDGDRVSVIEKASGN